jgi:uridine kinase
MEELPIDRGRSVAIGDSVCDIGAARAAGVWAYGVRTGYGCRDTERYPGGAQAALVPDLIFDGVRDAVRFAISYQAQAASLLKAIEQRKKRVVIGICGRSRSGKSVVAHALVRALKDAGRDCLHVRLDDWIVPAADRPADDSAEIRNRVDLLPALLAKLRGGETATAPGYDAANRVQGSPVTYDPTGHWLILLEGVFAAHRSVRSMIDIAVFVDASERVQRARFDALYRWKRFDNAAIEELWRARMADEWAAVDAQRKHCDIIITTDEP